MDFVITLIMMISLAALVVAITQWRKAGQTVRQNAGVPALRRETLRLQATLRQAGADCDRALARRALLVEREQLLLQELAREKAIIAAVKAAGPELLIKLGDPLTRKGERFLVAVSHSNGASATAEAPPVNPIWKSPRKVEVWATSRANARREVAACYPASAGFKIKSVSATKWKPE